jgi:hypothetical protein
MAAESVTERTVDHRPTPVASGAAITLSAVGVTVAGGIDLAVPVGLLVLGLFAIVGAVSWGSEEFVAAVLVGAMGSGLEVLAFTLPVTAGLDRLTLATAYPGLAGVAVLGLALAPVRRGWEATVATAGVALALLAVFTAGIVHTTDRFGVLVATVCVVAAWDAGRHAISLGEQVGRDAGTWTVELVHVTGTLLVGALVVALAEGVWRLGVTDLPLEGLLLFLGAAIAFILVLYE